jgi:hypothetical protein
MSGGLGEHEEASGPHWGWNLLLANAAGMLLCALIMDPSTQEGEVERGQLTILRGLFVLAAAGHVGVWALRAHLAADIVSATERWSSAPAELSLSSLVPQPPFSTTSPSRTAHSKLSPYCLTWARVGLRSRRFAHALCRLLARACVVGSF